MRQLDEKLVDVVAQFIADDYEGAASWSGKYYRKFPTMRHRDMARAVIELIRRIESEERRKTDA